MAQKRRTHTRKSQSKYAYLYTRHNNHKHVAQHNAYNYIAQTYQNTHCHCQCMSHTMTQKSYKNHSPPQHTRHVSYTRNSYSPRRNQFSNVEYFYMHCVV